MKEKQVVGWEKREGGGRWGLGGGRGAGRGRGDSGSLRQDGFIVFFVLFY